jgi:hypothetical protein
MAAGQMQYLPLPKRTASEDTFCDVHMTGTRLFLYEYLD